MPPKKTHEQAVSDARVVGRQRAQDADYAAQYDEFDELVRSWFRKYNPQTEKVLPGFEEQLEEMANQWLRRERANGVTRLPADSDELVSSDHALSYLFWRHVAIACCVKTQTYADGDVARRGAPVSTLHAMKLSARRSRLTHTCHPPRADLQASRSKHCPLASVFDVHGPPQASPGHQSRHVGRKAIPQGPSSHRSV